MDVWLLLFVYCLKLVSDVRAYDKVLVNIDDGPVQGDVIVLNTGVKINTFLGIPYAEPPTGPLRWKPPERPARWTEPFVADSLGNACIQDEAGLVWVTHPLFVRYSENCLNINVYAPNATGTYPVLVWFHGGSFQAGANIQYPGYFLAEKDTVVVVPNYRLNIIGFATTADAAARGNYGMLDQLAALQWVQANIGAFGGDPRQVTIFGESAGAHSVGFHMVSPLSRGLFHGAILMSGNELRIQGLNSPESHPENYIKVVAAQHDCPTDDNWQMMDCLRDVGARDLQATGFDCTPGYMCKGMVPVVDEFFLPDLPINLRKAGHVAAIPEMIGVTREEYTLFIAADYPDMLIRGPNRTEFEELVSDMVDYFMPRLPDQSQRDDLVASLTWYYSPWPHIDSRYDNRHQFSMMATDFNYGGSADFQMKMHARLPAPVYQYVFGYVSDNAYFPEWMGACHFSDFQYTWGFPKFTLNPDARNQSGLVDVMNYTQADIDFSDFMMTLITNFAKFGNPTQSPVPTPNGDSAVTWLPHTVEQLNYLYMGNDFVGMRENFRQHEYSFWNSYLNNMVYDHSWPFPDTGAGESYDPFIYRNKYSKLLRLLIADKKDFTEADEELKFEYYDDN